MAFGNRPSNASGSAIIDEPPPGPRDRVYSIQQPPGAETEMLLGGQSPDDINGAGMGADGMAGMGSGGALQTPGGKLLLAASMAIQFVNLAESISPGIVPPPVQQWVAQFMEQAPLLAEQMSRQSNPGAMLSAIGASATAGPPPMGMPAMQPGGMGMSPGGSGGGPMGGGGGRMPF